MAGNLFNRTSGTYANSKSNNNCDTLDGELNSIKTAFDVVETGTIDLGLGESSASVNYTEAALQDGVSSGTVGQVLYPSSRVFQGTAGLADVVVWRGITIPADAKASTACTFNLFMSTAGAADSGDMKVSYNDEVYAIGDTITSSNHTAAGKTDSTTFTQAGSYSKWVFFRLQFTTTLASANNMIHICVYRDADDAADTSANSLTLWNATLTYTRTA